MSTEQQSVDEQPSDTEADDQQDVLAQHRQAQERGEVFQGRPRVTGRCGSVEILFFRHIID
ncbi:hypothetical protein ACODNH_21575 (plasmid) [Haloarcula sp. NS06]|uniref:hypothetical protein n=1 Tax=Haloarcula sp. NS06 TaxID=3409688 RepID=UPI003DA6EF09